MPSASKKRKQNNGFAVPQILKGKGDKGIKGLSIFTSSRRQELKTKLKNEIDETEY